MVAGDWDPAGSTDGLRVVLRRERFVVIDKPAGLLSVPGKGPSNQDCACARARAMFAGATGPMVVHRLDMDTSGLLVLALDAATQRALSGQFERREVEKSYVALVEGEVGIESGIIEVPMRPDLCNRPMQVVDHAHGRPAVTWWRVLALETDRTRLELRPLTGRTHQLRVHAAYGGPGGLRGRDGDPSGRGHPVLGDVLYGDGASAPRLMLHAAALSFTDPWTGARVEARSPVPF